MLLDRMPRVRDYDSLSKMLALVMPEVEVGVPTQARITRISNIRKRNYGPYERGIAFDYRHITDMFKR